MTQINKKLPNQTAYDKKVKGADGPKDDINVAKKKDSDGEVNKKDTKFDEKDDAKLSGAKPKDKEDDAMDSVIGKKKDAEAAGSTQHNHTGATIAGAAIGAVLGPVGAIVGGLAGNAVAEFLSDD